MDNIKRSDIDDLFRIWKNLLGLHDWSINWNFIRGKKFDEPNMYQDSLGMFEGINEEHKIIFMKLSQNHKCFDELEHTVIHELLHSLFLILRYSYVKVFDYMLGAYTRKPFTKDTNEHAYLFYEEAKQALPFITALEKLTAQDAMNVEHPLVNLLTDVLFDMKHNSEKYKGIEDKQIKERVIKDMKKCQSGITDVGEIEEV